MLHYNGVIKDTLPIEPLIKKDSFDYNELLSFYDDNLSEKFCDYVKHELEPILDEYSLLQDFYLHIYYSEIENRVNIELTAYYDPNRDKLEQIAEAKSSFEKYYKQVVTPYYKKNKL